MVKFNNSSSTRKTITKNYEGEKAYKAGDMYMDLYLRTATQMVMTDKFYGDKKEQYEEWVTLVRDMAKKDPEFLLRLAAYTRNEMKLRTAPIVMLVEAALAGKTQYNVYPNNDLVKHYAPHIIKRADEMAEIIAYYITITGKIGTDTKGSNGLPNILKTIIKNELNSSKFSDYQLIKNDKNEASVKLRDVLRIVHPIPKDKQTKEFYRKIVKKESFAEIAQETWEGIIAQGGSNKETWSEAIKVMPIFATVRNIRNFFEHDVPFELINKHVIAKLRDKEVITKSRMLPFRFYQAYKEVKERNFETDAALEEAIRLAAVNNVPKFDGITAVFVDVSGSMESTLNDKSKMRYDEIAALFGAIIEKRCGATYTLICAYDDNVYPIKLGENDSVLYAMKKILAKRGGATDAWKCIKLLIDNQLKVDRIIFLSDEQSYNSGGRFSHYGSGSNVQQLMQLYRQTMNPDVLLYDIDLSGYGTLQFDPHNPKNVMMGGWSERVFDLMAVMDNGKKKKIQDVVREAYPEVVPVASQTVKNKRK